MKIIISSNESIDLQYILKPVLTKAHSTDMIGHRKVSLELRMAEKCEVTGKGKQFGHNVSFSQRKTQKIWRPNLQMRKIVIEGKKQRIKVSAAGLRTLRKQGKLAVK